MEPENEGHTRGLRSEGGKPNNKAVKGSPNLQKKLRVLCLHGHSQSASIFSAKTGAFRKILNKTVELVYIDAPLLLPKEIVNDEESQQEGKERVEEVETERYEWWEVRRRQQKPLEGTAKSEFEKDESFITLPAYQGLRESLQKVICALKEMGPFDGILGFSQGGVLTSILAALYNAQREQRGEEKTCDLSLEQLDEFQLPMLRFVILVSAFKPSDLSVSHLFSSPIKLPSLHIYGNGDTLVVKERSAELAQSFVSAEEFAHPGGHYIPTTSISKHVYSSFFNRFLSS